MSDENRPPLPKLDGYHAIELVSLRTNTTITFDCHVFLPANGKLIHWLRAGSVFGPVHAVKLERLGNLRILIPQNQKASYDAYIEQYKEPDKEPDKEPTKQEAKAAGTDLIHVKGSAPAESQAIRVFGGSIENDLGTFLIKDKTPAKPAAAPAKPKMQVDVGFINVSISAIQAVFSSICNVNLKFQTPTKRTESSVVPFPVNVASFINLNSGTIRGTIGLCFPSITYLNLLSAATGLKFAQVNEGVTLGAGEFMCHIFATARPGLAAIGYDVDLAVPFLVSGEDVPVRHVLPGHGFSFLINSDLGQFQYEIGIKTGG